VRQHGGVEVAIASLEKRGGAITGMDYKYFRHGVASFSKTAGVLLREGLLTKKITLPLRPAFPSRSGRVVSDGVLMLYQLSYTTLGL
jgi:hypothetical protein